MERNQQRMIGPKILPTCAVPRRWIAKSAVRMTTVSGTTTSSKRGVTIRRPSTAESTLIAGVMIPSPKSRPAASMSSQSRKPNP